MNKVYKIIFNKSLGVLQVASELVKSQGKQTSSKSSCKPSSLASLSASKCLATPPPYKLKAISLAIALSCTALVVPNVLAGTLPLSDGSPNPYSNTVDITGDPGSAGIYGSFSSSFEIINSSGRTITGGAGNSSFANYSSGVYMYSLAGASNTLTNNGNITGGAGPGYSGSGV